MAKKDNRVKLLNKENNLVNRLTKQVNKLAVSLAPKKMGKKKKSSQKKGRNAPSRGPKRVNTLSAIDAMLDPTLQGKVPCSMGAGPTTQALASYTFNTTSHFSAMVADTTTQDMVLILFLGSVSDDGRAVQIYRGPSTDTKTGVSIVGSSSDWRDRPTFATATQDYQELVKVNGYSASIKYSGAMIQRLGLCHLLVAHDHASASNLEDIITGWDAGTLDLGGVRDELVKSRYHKHTNFALGEEEEFVVPVMGTWSDTWNDTSLVQQYWLSAASSGEGSVVVAMALLDMGGVTSTGAGWPVGYTVECKCSGEIHSQANRMFLTPSPLASTNTNAHINVLSQAISHVVQRRESGVRQKDAVKAVLGMGSKFAKSKAGKKAVNAGMAAALGLLL